MLRWIDSDLQKEGLDSVRLAIVPLNLHALHTYFRHGYRIVECNDDYFGSSLSGRFRMISCRNESQLLAATQEGFIGVKLEKEEKEGASILFIKSKSGLRHAG